MSFAVADTAEAGLFHNRCGVARTPVRNVVRGTLHVGARIVTAPFRAVRAVRCRSACRVWHRTSCGWVRVNNVSTTNVLVAPSPTAAPTAAATTAPGPPVETAPSPPQ